MTDHDTVGHYNQDEINGFTESFLAQTADLLTAFAGPHILDAMCGDGSMLERLRTHINPTYTLNGMDSSAIQIARANAKALDHAAFCVGDILTWEPPAGKRYDLIYAKSSTHEISQAQKGALYRHLYDLLMPGGAFINLDALCPDETSRYAFNRIIHEKDRIAGLYELEKNRDIESKAGYYARLHAAGFQSIDSLLRFHYRLNSSVIRDVYFAKETTKEQQWIGVQKRLIESIPVNCVYFCHEGHSVLSIPGEITLARK